MGQRNGFETWGMQRPNSLTRRAMKPQRLSRISPGATPKSKKRLENSLITLWGHGACRRAVGAEAPHVTCFGPRGPAAIRSEFSGPACRVGRDELQRADL